MKISCRTAKRFSGISFLNIIAIPLLKPNTMKHTLTISLLLISLLFTSRSIATPNLNSLPSAQATIYLDFDGQLVQSTPWNGGNMINCEASGFSNADITMIFHRVSEDFRPFNINITTEEAKFLAAPLTTRIRIIITTTNYFKPGVGGSAYTGSFSWGDDTPGFVFPNMLGMNTKYAAEACSHESGHTLFLSHQSKYDNSCIIVQNYNDGIGTGETSWAPLMGIGYYRNLSAWNNGPTPSGCTESQDNLSIITSYNSFTYRTDDHSSDINAGSTILNVSNQLFNENGVITTSSDKDFFRLDISQNSNVHFEAHPFSVGPNNDGANLDIKICLFNNAKQLLRTFDPESILHVSFDTALTSGSYYVMVKGAGNSNSTEYGSLGSYSITGKVEPLGVTPIRNVSLQGKVQQATHKLDWKIISDDPVRSIEIETSVNGSPYTLLTPVGITGTRFTYNPLQTSDILYRLRVTSVINQVVLSNAVMLKGSTDKNSFSVQTLVHGNLVINAGAAYEFELISVNGRMIIKGKRGTGLNTEDINALPSGIYVLQIISDNQKITKRIIKQ